MIVVEFYKPGEFLEEAKFHHKAKHAFVDDVVRIDMDAGETAEDGIDYHRGFATFVVDNVIYAYTICNVEQFVLMALKPITDGLRKAKIPFRRGRFGLQGAQDAR